MSLAFLLPAGLAALAALVVPLLLHLARRYEQTPTDFAALRWLRQKPKPRHRIRFDEWPLLLLRLLLLAWLSLWLARPVLSGLDDTRPWTVAVPGVDAGLARASSDARARLHWLAPDFPSLDEPAPAGTPAIGSLLRQLDAELPTGVALTVIVPATLQGADAERPALSRAVTWQVVDGAMPASSARASPPPSLAIRHPAGDEHALRYLRAAARAWQPTGAPAVQIGPPTRQCLRRRSRWCGWHRDRCPRRSCNGSRPAVSHCWPMKRRWTALPYRRCHGAMPTVRHWSKAPRTAGAE